MNHSASMDGTTGALLQARSVTKRYGGFTAVDAVSLDVMPGSIHSVIGPNGAGKTTLFHTLTGTVPITAGSIRFAGQEVGHLPGHQRVQSGMARSFQVTSLFQDLSVRENLRVAAQGRSPRQALFGWRPPAPDDAAMAVADVLLARFRLGPVAGRAAALLSHGQQRRLVVAMALPAQRAGSAGWAEASGGHGGGRGRPGGPGGSWSGRGGGGGWGPPASRAGWRWPWRWPRSRASSSWTSPPPAWASTTSAR